MRLRATHLLFASTALVLSGCGQSLQPITTGQPVPQATAGTGTASGDGALGKDPVTAGGVALPESLSTQARAAMVEAGAALGLSDSALFAIPSRDSLVPAALTEAEEEEEVSWDIDVLSYATHDRVARYVTLFTGPAKERIESRLTRGKRYEPMIREKFRARGIPEDMYYLGLVESGYDPHAYSRAAAVGMWQFMSTTARGVGLRVDWWVDERRDPVKATDAAAKFLNALHAQFGSYYLAAAAYNGGPGRVSRGLARFQDELEQVVGDDRFFALAEQTYLRSETRNYVPQLIAAALIGKTPSRYGLSVADTVAPFSYDSVRVAEFTSLGTIAQASQSTVAEIQDLNPHFLRGATPPRYSGFVRVPTGKRESFDSLFLAIPAEERAAFTDVRSKKGQTLTSIAKAHGMDGRRLAWYNPGVSATKKLAAGRIVRVPAAHVIAASRDVPDPGIERYGTSARTSSGRVVHVVKRGESLGLIAKRYKTTVASLRRLNGLKRTVVYPGQSIIVRGATRARPSRTASR